MAGLLGKPVGVPPLCWWSPANPFCTVESLGPEASESGQDVAAVHIDTDVKGNTMAKKVITTLVDDVDGSTATQSVDFGLDGVTFTIDVSDGNAEKLRAAFEPFIAAGSRVGRTGVGNWRPGATAGARRSAVAVDNRAVRAWAADNGLEVSDRGRISAEILAKYRAAQV
jgi:hypothetical protein